MKYNKVIISIKSFFHSVFYSNKKSDSQIILFNKIEPGDIVFSRMPLNNKDIKRIEAGHTSRPYLILSKKKNYLLAFPCTSKEHKNLPEPYQHKLPHIVYHFYKKKNVSTDTYVNLSNLSFLYPEHLGWYMGKLNEYDKELIERKLTVLYPDKSIRFSVKFRPFIGDIYKHNNELYYVYQEYKKTMYCYKLYEKKRKSPWIEINDKYYWFDRKKKYTLKFKENELYYMLNSKIISMTSDKNHK